MMLISQKAYTLSAGVSTRPGAISACRLPGFAGPFPPPVWMSQAAPRPRCPIVARNDPNCVARLAPAQHSIAPMIRQATSVWDETTGPDVRWGGARAGRS
jgi:hypothetical protein